MGSYHTEVPSPAIAAFVGFATQAKPVRFESTGASALHTLLFGFNPSDATKTQEIGYKMGLHYLKRGDALFVFVTLYSRACTRVLTNNACMQFSSSVT